MSELETLNIRITITRAMAKKKAEYYHKITTQGNPARRKEVLLDCVKLRAELRELEQRRVKLLGGADNGKGQTN